MATDPRTDYLILALLAASTGLWINVLRQGLRSGWSWPLQPRRDVPWRPFEAVAAIIIVQLCMGAVLYQLFPPVRPVATDQAGRGADVGTIHTAPTPDVPKVLDLKRLQVIELSQILELALVPFILLLWCRCRWEDFGLRRVGLTNDLRFAAWGLLLAQLPVYLVEYPLRSWRQSSPHPILELLRNSGHDNLTLVWIALEVVLLAPLVEELLFRVLLQGSLEREIPAVWAILLPALAFVASHQTTDSMPLFPLALVMGYIYYRRHSFVANVVLHGMFNAISLLTAVWSLNEP